SSTGLGFSGAISSNGFCASAAGGGEAAVTGVAATAGASGRSTLTPIEYFFRSDAIGRPLADTPLPLHLTPSGCVIFFRHIAHASRIFPMREFHALLIRHAEVLGVEFKIVSHLSPVCSRVFSNSHAAHVVRGRVTNARCCDALMRETQKLCRKL